MAALASPSPRLPPAASQQPALRPSHPGAPGQGTKDSPWARRLRGRPCPDQQVRSDTGQRSSGSECFQTLHSGRQHVFFISLRKKNKKKETLERFCQISPLEKSTVTKLLPGAAGDLQDSVQTEAET